MIPAQINHYLNEIKKYAQASNSNAQLLAVSKTFPAQDVQTAYDAGQRHFGENYLNDAVEKIDQLEGLDIQWHFIGPLQSNKTKAVAQKFQWLQSLDRIKIAKRINHQRPEELAPLNVLIQVNISQEPQKSGVLLEDVELFANQLLEFKHIKLRGLMCIGESGLAESQLEEQFLQMKQKFDLLANKYDAIDCLSMGMSQDYQQALKSGATMIRIGTGIFGHRSK